MHHRFAYRPMLWKQLKFLNWVNLEKKKNRKQKNKKD